MQSSKESRLSSLTSVACCLFTFLFYFFFDPFLFSSSDTTEIQPRCGFAAWQVQKQRAVFLLLSKIHKPNFFQICVSDLCRLLGMTVVEKKRGLWNRVVGEVERDTEMEWRKRKKERESTRTWNSLTHPLALSLFHTHTQKHKKDWQAGASKL